VAKRIGVLATIVLVLFAVVIGQAANIQFLRAPALNASAINPRTNEAATTAPRGQIVAADGTILAESQATGQGVNVYQRVYPLGSLVSSVVGFDSPTYGLWGLEAQYNKYLQAHAQAPQSLAQILSPTTAADNITLTIEPALQKIARNAMGGQDGAAVVLDPRNGAVLGIYSNPNYDPTPLESTNVTTAEAAWKSYTTNDAHGFAPLGLVATQQTFPPGSTFKVITTAAVVTSRPDLLIKSYPSLRTTKLPDTTKTLSNFGNEKCGGTIAQMLPPSCDTGYALVGLDLGADILATTANSFGYNLAPPLDLPGVVASNFPSAASFTGNLPGLAYSAIGQENVRASALQNALVAAGIANGGTIMAPHLLSYVTSPDGTTVYRYPARVWQTPLTSVQAAQIVPLMQNVVRYGTAAGLFPAADDVAAKTGTAQTGNSAKNTDDWMIAFAPATNPTVAVAVVMPFQVVSQTGATVAGPIVKCLVEGALALQAGQPATGTANTCPN
jgi:penicillin-binding protein A